MAPRISTASTKKKNDQEIINLATKVAEKTARKTANKVALSPNFDDGFEDDEDDSPASSFAATFDYDDEEEEETREETQVAAPSQIVQEADLRDVFDIGNETMKAEGVPVKYYIRRNGSLAGTEMAPYSIEKLQTKYGAGEYMVMAKRSTNGKFVKQQSFSVDAPLTDGVIEKKEEARAETGKIMNSFEAILAATQEANERTTEKMIELQREQAEREDRRRQEEREREEERKREEKERLKMETANTNGLMSTVLQIIAKPKEDNSLVTLMQMMEQQRQSQIQADQLKTQMFMQSMEKITESQNRMFEKLTERQDRDRQDLFKAIEALKDNKKDDKDPLELVKLLRDSQKEALADYHERKEMIREELESVKGHSEPKSMTDKLLENLAPLLLMGAQMKGQAPAAAPMAPTPAHRAAEPVRQVQAPTTVAKVSPSLKKTVPAVTPAVRPVVQASVVSKPVVKSETVEVKKTVDQNSEASKINHNADLKAKVIAYAAEHVGTGIMSLKDGNPISPAQVAATVSSGLRENGLPTSEVVRLVSFADLEHTAYNEHGLPRIEILSNYLRDFYEALCTIGNQESGNLTHSEGANPQ